MAKHKALFLDRDGVVNHDDGYTHRVDDVRYMDGVFDFCRRAKASGFLIFIITNQAGIARGYYSEAQFHRLMQAMQARFEKEGAGLSGYYFCPHHPEFTGECSCRKPRPGMILQAAREHGLALGESMLIGDKPSDIEAGRAAGVGRCEMFDGTWPEIVTSY